MLSNIRSEIGDIEKLLYPKCVVVLVRFRVLFSFKFVFPNFKLSMRCKEYEGLLRCL